MADAKALGTHRVYLYEVLSGKKTSHILTRRYQELQATKGAAK